VKGESGNVCDAATRSPRWRRRAEAKAQGAELRWEQFEELPHGVLIGGWTLHVGYLSNGTMTLRSTFTAPS